MGLAPVGITFVSKGTSNLVRDLENVRKQLGKYGDTAEQVGKEARTSAAGVRAMNRAMGSANDTVSTSTKSIANLRRGFSTLGVAVNAPSKAVGALGTSIQRLGQKSSDVGRRLTQAGAGITALVTVPIILGFKQATTAALDFEKEIIKLNTQIGLGTADVKVFNDAILGIGQSSLAIETATNTAELAGGAFVIASAGIRDTDQAMELLTQSAKASKIGLGSVADIARTAAGAMQAFGVGGSQAMDVLLATVREGNLEASSLAGAFGKVGGLARSLGVEFSQAGAFVATFTRSGASAASAVTSLRSILTTIAKEPSKAAKEALGSIGLTIEEVRRGIEDPNIGLNKTLIEMSQRFEDTGQTGVEFFRNIRAFAGFAFVTGIPEELARIDASIANSEGIVDQGFKTIQETAGFQIEQFKATVDVLAVTVGNVLLPIITAALARILPFIEAIRQFASENPKLLQIASIFLLIAATVGPLIILLGTLGLAFGGITAAAGAVVSVIGALISPFGAVIGVVLGLAAAVGGPLLLGFANLNGVLNKSLGEIASDLFVWGREIIVQFAKGMIAGAVAVVQALRQIGQVISSWLSPGSPPRLLPDIDQWGTAAMNEFINGFTLADFDTFDAIADITEKIIRSGVDEITEGTISQITDFRERIAQAASGISALTAGGGGFTELAESIGFADEQLTAYADTMFRLQSVSEQVLKAQEEIEKINQSFTQVVAPLNEELDAIEARRDEVRRAQRTEELQSIIDDASAPDLAKELALLELREFELLDQVDAEEALRDAALEEANAKLAALEAEQSALKTQAELQLRVIEAQLRQNELLDESKQAIENLTGAIGSLAGELEGLGGVDFEGLGGIGEFEEFDFSEIIGEGVGEAADEIELEMSNLFADLIALVQPLIDEWERLRNTWTIVAALLTGQGVDFDETQLGMLLAELKEDLDEIATLFEPAEKAFENLDTVLQESVAGFEESFIGIRDAINTDLGFGEDSSIVQIGKFLGGLLVFLVNVFAVGWSFFTEIMLAPVRAVAAGLPLIFDGILEQLRTAFSGDEPSNTGLEKIMAGMWLIVTESVRLIGEAFLNLVDVVLGEEWRATFDAWVVSSLISIISWALRVKTAFDQLWFLLKFNIILFLLNASLFFSNFFTTTGENFTTWKDEQVTTFTNFKDESLEKIETFFTDAIADAEQGVLDIAKAISDGATNMKTAGEDMFEGFRQGILAKGSEIIDAAVGLVNELTERIREALGEQSPSKILRQIGNFAGQGLALGLTDTTELVGQSATNLGSVIAPQVVSASTTSNTSAEVNMGGVNINNGMDQMLFEAAVRRVLTQALGETL